MPWPPQITVTRYAHKIEPKIAGYLNEIDILTLTPALSHRRQPSTTTNAEKRKTPRTTEPLVNHLLLMAIILLFIFLVQTFPSALHSA